MRCSIFFAVFLYRSRFALSKFLICWGVMRDAATLASVFLRGCVVFSNFHFFIRFWSDLDTILYPHNKKIAPLFGCEHLPFAMNTVIPRTLLKVLIKIIREPIESFFGSILHIVLLNNFTEHRERLYIIDTWIWFSEPRRRTTNNTHNILREIRHLDNYL